MPQTSKVSPLANSSKLPTKPQGEKLDWTALAVGAMLLTGVWCVWRGMLEHEFVWWDDDQYVFLNPYIRKLGWEELTWMWGDFHVGNYHPLTWMSYAFDSLRGGLEPRVYLSTNLLLHLLNGVLLWQVCQTLRKRIGDNGAWGRWISWSVLVYLRATHFQTKRTHVWMIGSGLLFAAALLSKPSAIGLPLLLILMDVFLLKRMTNVESRWQTGRRLLLEKWVHLLSAAGMVLLAPLAQTSAGASVALQDHTLLGRMIQAAHSCCYYPWKTCWPSSLNCLHVLQLPLNGSEPRFVISCLVVLLTSSWAVWKWHQGDARPLAVAAAYVVLLLPISGLWALGSQLVAERYSYHPAMLLSLSSVGLGSATVAAWWQNPVGRWVLSTACVVVLSALSWGTQQELQHWSNSYTLWTDALADDPLNCIAHHNLGKVYLERKEFAQAKACFEQACQINPNSPLSLTSLGALEAAAGNTEAAIGYYQKSLALAPDYYETQYNLANQLMIRQQTAEALPLYRQAWQQRPESFPIGANYARALLLDRQWEAAGEVYRQVVRLDPQASLGWEGLGRVYLKQRQAEAALPVLGKAYECRDAGPATALLLAEAHEQLGDSSSARRILQAASFRWPQLARRPAARP